MKISLPPLFGIKELKELYLPHLCLLCGQHVSPGNASLCVSCESEALERTNEKFNQTCQGIVLPEIVAFQDALFEFDKGGHLQEIMHAVKYKGDLKIAGRLGELLGEKLLNNPYYQSFSKDHEPLIVPVPLHKNKQKKRGYNQAEEIAIGLQRVLKGRLIAPSNCIRKVHTDTQTGFTREERRANMSNVFWATQSVMKDQHCLIVDDVFTTGATTFELAETLSGAGAAKCAVVTIAQA